MFCFIRPFSKSEMEENWLIDCFIWRGFLTFNLIIVNNNSIAENNNINIKYNINLSENIFKF